MDFEMYGTSQPLKKRARAEADDPFNEWTTEGDNMYESTPPLFNFNDTMMNLSLTESGGIKPELDEFDLEPPSTLNSASTLNSFFPNSSPGPTPEQQQQLLLQQHLQLQQMHLQMQQQLQPTQQWFPQQDPQTSVNPMTPMPPMPHPQQVVPQPQLTPQQLQQQQETTILTPVTPLQFTPKTSEVSLFLTTTHQQFTTQKEEFEKLKWFQQDLLSKPVTNPALLSQLETWQTNVQKQLQTMYLQLETLMVTKCLDAGEIYKIGILKNEILLEIKHLEVYAIELIRLMKPEVANTGVPACLFISKQPFPKAIRQNKEIENVLTVRLLTASQSQSLWPTGAVTASVVTFPGGAAAPATKKTLCVLNNTKPLNANIADFNNLKFPVGSRKRAIQLQFKLDVQLGNTKATIDSNLSQPFIVQTNENQYTESEGILLSLETFGDATETTWAKFTNVLQKHYLAATKQDRQTPRRPLSNQDFLYIYNAKFTANTVPSPNAIINKTQFNSFWDWFGPSLYKIRYQRHCCSMWNNGLICGFIGKSETERVLENASPGAFIIRFSEQRAGQLAIAYVPLNASLDLLSQETAPQAGRIRHYLMQPDDVHAAKKTLPDFLRRSQNLSLLVQVTNDTNRGKVYQQCPKDEMLASYYSKKTAETCAFGYDGRTEINETRKYLMKTGGNSSAVNYVVSLMSRLE